MKSRLMQVKLILEGKDLAINKIIEANSKGWWVKKIEVADKGKEK